MKFMILLVTKTCGWTCCRAGGRHLRLFVRFGKPHYLYRRSWTSPLYGQPGKRLCWCRMLQHHRAS
ncbi:hypothetical protein PF005_g5318 [Phytophthora fragariae]|uniref:Secreted protein n=1 Tax=Phytophthora fragariae TaxID=53985 RepID=A0A6A3UAA5_9STRA|nr:hypothetical protein PF003_g27152 [Phytophthora fragariae]KAE8949680.1 hypothetical protein PF009_g800 [Phytophthora fragariae]KAE9021532.1 hypothetical protein PF011_g4887 [Phytophthora fragariae]KAE9117804.1 hypothetical protein PF010_g8474 [Phytophthora fragariae]KAE9131206.1 hypothetical protein PF007_g4242 [Phytophthora fragariae]